MTELDVSRFYERLGKIHSHFKQHRSSAWGGATCLSLNGTGNEDENPYLKSVVLYHYLFGYELPDTILILTESGMCYILSTKRKCEFLNSAVGKAPPGGSILGVTLLQKNKNDGNEENFSKLMKEIQLDQGDDSSKVGVIMKEVSKGKGDTNGKGKKNLVSSWEDILQKDKVEMVDVAPGISLVMSLKDELEIDMMRKSSVLSNKVLKHGFVPRIEEVIDNEMSVTHEQIASEVDGMIEDPSKINLKVPKEHVESCYFPILQSGGTYDLKLNAQSSDETVKYDIIIVSLGARYQMYCSNISRTFLVDPPKAISDTYDILLGMQNACIEAMVPQRRLSTVYYAAIDYLKSSGNGGLVKSLPKNLGFSMGLDFRDSALVLSPKNQVMIRSGMLFNLSVGFSGVALSDSDKSSVGNKSAVKSVKTYALQVADMVVVTSKSAEVLTKHAKALTDISYVIGGDSDESSDEGGNASHDDAAYAKSLANQEDKYPSGKRASARLAKNNTGAQDTQEGASERERRQVELMSRKNEERIRELARANAKNKGADKESDLAEELITYNRARDYPDYVMPNQVKVDMKNECVILPIFGNPIPFHISTIKNVVLPDPDLATYLRINFYTAGSTIGKDTPVNMGKLILKHAPYASFIRELTFRSLDSHNLTQAFRQISELRKRVRQREIREQEEANLVKQEKLVRTKNERVPRLSDLTLRPVFSGRKTQGNIEAHTNGLRFISTRGEIVDVMYSNIKHAIYQPCENEIMVLIHFHLRNPIMLGKKRQKDIQVFTEVVDASLQVDAGRRSMYDPDEMDDEQRERQLRKKLNQAFKEFCRKVESTAKKNGYSLEFDIPYRDLGFNGTPHNQMVFVQPTLNCLVNVTDTPFFVTDLSEVDHVHFERVTFMSKTFDVVLINKDFSKQPWRVDMIPNSDKDAIQDWLTDMELSYTEGPMNLNWKQIMLTCAGDDRFYMNTEEDEITQKEAGWEFLRMFGRDNNSDDDDDEDDDAYSEEAEADGGGESEADSDSNSEESEFDSESEDESDFDADQDLEEQGMDWEDMEKAAMADDRRRKQSGRDEEEDARLKAKRGNGSQSRGSSKRTSSGSGRRVEKRRRR